MRRLSSAPARGEGALAERLPESPMYCSSCFFWGTTQDTSICPGRCRRLPQPPAAAAGSRAGAPRWRFSSPKLQPAESDPHASQSRPPRMRTEAIRDCCPRLELNAIFFNSSRWSAPRITSTGPEANS